MSYRVQLIEAIGTINQHRRLERHTMLSATLPKSNRRRAPWPLAASAIRSMFSSRATSQRRQVICPTRRVSPYIDHWLASVLPLD